MADLIYFATTTLDGFIEGPDGSFGWGAPSDEVHAFINDRIRPTGTFLYGRRMYETMTVWETDPELAQGSPVQRDFAQIWLDIDKVVYSTTLDEPVTARTRIERSFDADAVRELKASSDRPLMTGGHELAACAFRAGLVDELNLFVVPHMVGSGKPGLPDVELSLELLETQGLDGGRVFSRYRVLG